MLMFQILRKQLHQQLDVDSLRLRGQTRQLASLNGTRVRDEEAS